MKIAILSVTNQGKIISDKLYENLVKNPLILHIQQYHKNIKSTVAASNNTNVIGFVTSKMYMFFPPLYFY